MVSVSEVILYFEQFFANVLADQLSDKVITEWEQFRILLWEEAVISTPSSSCNRSSGIPQNLEAVSSERKSHDGLNSIQKFLYSLAERKLSSNRRENGKYQRDSQSHHHLSNQQQQQYMHHQQQQQLHQHQHPTQLSNQQSQTLLNVPSPMNFHTTVTLDSHKDSYSSNEEATPNASANTGIHAPQSRISFNEYPQTTEQILSHQPLQNIDQFSQSRQTYQSRSSSALRTLELRKTTSSPILEKHQQQLQSLSSLQQPKPPLNIRTISGQNTTALATNENYSPILKEISLSLNQSSNNSKNGRSMQTGNTRYQALNNAIDASVGNSSSCGEKSYGVSFKINQTANSRIDTKENLPPSLQKGGEKAIHSQQIQDSTSLGASDQNLLSSSSSRQLNQRKIILSLQGGEDEVKRAKRFSEEINSENVYYSKQVIPDGVNSGGSGANNQIPLITKRSENSTKQQFFEPIIVDSVAQSKQSFSKQHQNQQSTVNASAKSTSAPTNFEFPDEKEQCFQAIQNKEAQLAGMTPCSSTNDSNKIKILYKVPSMSQMPQNQNYKSTSDTQGETPNRRLEMIPEKKQSYPLFQSVQAKEDIKFSTQTSETNLKQQSQHSQQQLYHQQQQQQQQPGIEFNFKNIAEKLSLGMRQFERNTQLLDSIFSSSISTSTPTNVKPNASASRSRATSTFQPASRIQILPTVNGTQQHQQQSHHQLQQQQQQQSQQPYFNQLHGSYSGTNLDSNNPKHMNGVAMLTPPAMVSKQQNNNQINILFSQQHQQSQHQQNQLQLFPQKRAASTSLHQRNQQQPQVPNLATPSMGCMLPQSVQMASFISGCGGQVGVRNSFSNPSNTFRQGLYNRGPSDSVRSRSAFSRDNSEGR